MRVSRSIALALALALALACTKRGAPASEPSEAVRLYSARCAGCHGENGRGDGLAAAGLRPAPRSFADPAWQSATTDARIRAVIAQGGAAHGLSPAMPAHSDLTPQEILQLTRHIRQFAGGTG